MTQVERNGGDSGAGNLAQESPRAGPTPNGGRETPRASSERTSERASGREAFDWEKASRVARHASRWAPIKPKTAYADGHDLLLIGAALQTGIPEDCFSEALYRLKTTAKVDKPLPYLCACFGREVARHRGMANPDQAGPNVFRELRQGIRIPERVVQCLLKSLTTRQSTTEEREAGPDYLAGLPADERQRAEKRIEDYIAALSATERDQLERAAIQAAPSITRASYQKNVAQGRQAAAKAVMAAVLKKHVFALLKSK